jgi:hypothetical protein
MSKKNRKRRRNRKSEERPGLTVDRVQQRVREIANSAAGGDWENTHGREDGLHHDVLRAIAEGADNPVELAQAALETLKLDFERWCA